MTTVARLKVLMEADSHRLTSALSRVKKQVFNVRSAFTVLAGAGGVGALVSSQLKAADEMGKFSKRIGISVEALSELRHAAELSGIQTNTLETSLQRLVRRVAEVATTGKGEAKSTLEQLGLDAEKLNNMDVDVMVGTIAEALSKVDTQGGKVAAAMKLMDTEGVAMLQMFGEGSAGLDKLREAARKAGVTLTEEGAAGAERANDAMAQLKATISGLAQAFAIQLAPEIGTALEWVVSVIPKLLAGFKTLGKVIGAIAATAAAIFRGDFAGAAAIGNINVGDIYRETLNEGGDSTAEEVGKAMTRALDNVALIPVAG